MRTLPLTAGSIVAALCLTACEGDTTAPNPDPPKPGVEAQSKSTIAAAPKLLSFRMYAFVPGQDPQAQTLIVTNNGDGGLAWTASTKAKWIKLGPASGTAPGQLQVGLNRAGFKGMLEDRPALLNGVITLSSAGASNSPVQVRVSVNISYLSPDKAAPGGGSGPRPPF
jgi:Viral BACON domain